MREQLCSFNLEKKEKIKTNRRIRNPGRAFRKRAEFIENKVQRTRLKQKFRNKENPESVLLPKSLV